MANEEVRTAIDPRYVEGIGTVMFADYARKRGYPMAPTLRDMYDVEPCIVCGAPYCSCTPESVLNRF